MGNPGGHSHRRYATPTTPTLGYGSLRFTLFYPTRSRTLYNCVLWDTLHQSKPPIPQGSLSEPEQSNIHFRLGLVKQRIEQVQVGVWKQFQTHSSLFQDGGN